MRTYRRGKFLETTAKSILGLIDVYNLLPQAVIDTNDVQTFQAKLQAILKDQAISNVRNWESHFSPRHVMHLHPLARAVNEVVTVHATIATIPGADEVVAFADAQVKNRVGSTTIVVVRHLVNNDWMCEHDLRPC